MWNIENLIFLSFQTLTNVLWDPQHVMEMQTVPILMVHSNANVKLDIQGMGIHAKVFMRRFQTTKLIFIIHRYQSFFPLTFRS